MADSYINLSQTDFEQVKSSLTSFIKTKDEFTDYDFTGSALSTLIDLLAYNTAFFSTYTNFLANESFIDSAQKRDSIMSLARLVGYTPKSRIAARAELSVVLLGDTGVIPANTVFDGGDTGYNFITLDEITLGASGNERFAGDITVYQNSSKSKTTNTTFFNGKITIPEQADVSNIRVFVGADADAVEYTKAERISVLTASSKVFFLDPIYSGAYEVSFGDGLYGAEVEPDSSVRAEYLTPNGINNANGESNFTNSTFQTITTKTASYGGAERETTESIRRNAPSYFQAQNRAVTANDAEIVFKVDNPEVYDATAWGGEDNNPPQYGRLFLSAIKDAAGTTFSAEELSALAAKLQEKTVVGILPEFKDRRCYQINIPSGVVIYDDLITTDTALVRGLVEQKLQQYDPVCGFRGIFKYSTIAGELVSENASIRSVELDVDISGSFSNATYADNTDDRNLFISFANSIVPGSVYSDRFFVNDSLGFTEDGGRLDDDGNGFIRLLDDSGTVKNYRQGTVDYITGNITVLNLTSWDAARGFDDGGTVDLTIHAVPVSKAVRSIRQATYEMSSNIPTFDVVS